VREAEAVKKELASIKGEGSPMTRLVPELLRRRLPILTWG